MKKVALLLPLMVSVLLLAGCSYSNNSQNTATSPEQNQMSNKVVTGNTVTIENFAFSPAALTVKKGTTVTWTNNDSAPHQIKSTTFNSDKLSTGQSFSFTFNEIGTYDYNCAIHPSMQGKIIVE